MCGPAAWLGDVDPGLTAPAGGGTVGKSARPPPGRTGCSLFGREKDAERDEPEDEDGRRPLVVDGVPGTLVL